MCGDSVFLGGENPSLLRVQPGYKTQKTEQIKTTQVVRSVQPPDTKTPKSTKWEKENVFPNQMHAHQPLGARGNYKIVRTSNMNQH